MSYDTWKTNNPDDQYLDSAPQDSNPPEWTEEYLRRNVFARVTAYQLHEAGQLIFYLEDLCRHAADMLEPAAEDDPKVAALVEEMREATNNE